ncbi:MAG: SBBP repeat-containing protein [Candidatus Angelobacter sp.]
MLTPLRSVIALCILLNAVLSVAADRASSSAPVNFSFAIEVNRGQTAPEVKYLARSREGVLFFAQQGVTVAVPRVGAFRMLFENAAVPAIAAEEKLISRSNYLSNQAKPIANVENFGALLYAALYRGIDVRFYGQGRHLEHDFILAPGADPNQIALRFEGLDYVALTSAGDLELTLGGHHLRETAPVAWQTINGKTKPVAAYWKIIGDARLGITLGAYDHSLPITIDPVLAYSTHLGGTTGNDLDTGTTFPADTAVSNIGMDAQHNVYVSGTTSAADYPTTAGAFDRNPSIQSVFHEDATTQSGFVSKFDPTGRILIYSTFLRVSVEAMAVDPAGHVYSAEEQFIEDPGPNFSFDEGIHLDKLSVDGSKLLFTTMFAQTFDNSTACQAFSSSFPTDLAADNSGHIWMAGDTVNPCMPATPGAFQTTMPNANGNGFVAKFDTNKPPATALVYATYISASTNSSGMSSVGIDSTGNVYLAGTTSATNFPHGASFGSGAAMMFAAKLNPAGSGLVFSTLIHGATSVALALDSAHNIYLAGQALSGFPTTTGAFRRVVTGTNCHDFVGNAIQCADGFVTKLSPGGGTLLYSTFLGGSNDDTISDISLNSAGMAFVTGFTNSTDFPTTASAFKKSIPAGVVNSFVTALQPDGKSLYYSTLLGGSHSTKAGSVVVDPAWNAWVGGNTSDTDYPVTPDAFQPGMKGESDGFFAKIVIAGDLRATLVPATATVLHNSVVTFTANVTNLGPDGSDAVVLSDVIPSGFSFSGISGSTATSCSIPAIGATAGSIVCHKTRLEKGQSFGVKINLRAIAASGSHLTNRVTASARTQDLNQANNAAQASVLVK